MLETYYWKVPFLVHVLLQKIREIHGVYIGRDNKRSIKT
jgi:hypothetical protein